MYSLYKGYVSGENTPVMQIGLRNIRQSVPHRKRSCAARFAGLAYCQTGNEKHTQHGLDVYFVLIKYTIKMHILQ